MNGPAVPLRISVVIPVKNASNVIRDCLDAVYSNKDIGFEVIVVNDGCTDNTMDIVSEYKCAVLKNKSKRGVSGARNTGAWAAKGGILVFIDSDIVVPDNALLKISESLRHPDIAAVVGMLSEGIRYKNFSSQYKNLWMCWTFNNLAENISLIFTSITGVKKEVFLKIGGFDANYRFPCIEDNEFGIRLKEGGYNIALDKTLQVEHLKHYTFLGLLKTHYFRAKGLIKLYNRKKLISFFRGNPSSVPNTFFLNIPLSIAAAYFLLGYFKGNNYYLNVLISMFFFCAAVLVNYKWLFFLNMKGGLSLAFKGLFYIPIESLVISFGLLTGQIEYFVGKKY